jgi:DNA helicase-2/ATP-dependent DNA helicase PcrA
MTDPFDLGSLDVAAPVRAGEPPYLAKLNEAQRQAVEATEGPVLVLAGAGTGKTRVLTTRLAHLLDTGRAWPGQILAVTFTNRAAAEMHERVAEHIGGVVEGLWLGTFHAMGVRILRRHAELVGLKGNFTILDADDQIRLLKQVLQAANVDANRWPARALLAIIDRWKSRGLDPDKVPAAEVGEFAGGRALDLYRAYQARLRSVNAADFGDLLLCCLDLFTAHGDVLADYQRRFKYILVDEYQDTNVAQYLWLRLLARGRNNICCVGDDDQSIYSWRGAEVGNILRFENDFPGARVIRLERNYRSTPHILGAASALIAHNQGRLGKKLWTDETAGAPVVVRGVWDGEDEARAVADEIEALQAKGERLSETAILVRAGFQTREFEDRFLARGLPYRVIGGLRFYERQEIRDVIAYLRVVAQEDDDLAFERIVNVPKRGLGERSVQAINVLSRTRGLSLAAAARELVRTEALKGRARNGLAALLEGFERWRAAAQALSLAELVVTVLEESGYSARWEADKSPEAPGRLENLQELVHALEEFETLAEFLEHISLVMDNAGARGGDAINLMTLHGAKGLEFDSVFLPGWEEGLFPHQRALAEGGDNALEEERRLAHVGITRARKLVHISHAASRRVFNQWLSNIPSRFVDELPPEHLEVRAEPGLYAGIARAGARAAAGGEGLEEPAAGFAPTTPRPALGRRQSRYDRFVRGRGPLASADPGKAKLPDSGAEYAAGDRVFHQKFGYGRVVAVDGNKLDIAFEKAGTKKVIANFVEPA